MTKLTKSQEVAADVVALLRARTSLLWIVTREEARVEGHLFAAADAAKYKPVTWDVGQGICDFTGVPVVDGAEALDPGAAMAAITEAARAKSEPERRLWIMRDLPVWLSGGLSGATTLRQVRNLARMLPTTPRETAQAMVVLSPSGDVPAELAGHATVIEWPLPDRAEIEAILDDSLAALPDDVRAGAAPNGQRDKAIDAAVGLTGLEAQACYAKSLVQLRRIDPAAVAAEKKRVIARERVLEWYDPLPGGMDSVGGLENLKAWLLARASAYSPAARAYGLPAPKGCVLVGVPGCGKSLTAKAIATTWQCPLLRFDMGALKSKFVGESEGNLRRALKVAEAIGRCVLWIDEIEKALQGATSGSSDGGVSSDALGTLLSWMQERAGEVFVVATANDVSALPPELLRKGRFDEIFFVDLPNEGERDAILRAALKSHGRAIPGLKGLELQTAGFTGAEIAELVPAALYAAFADGQREVTALDLFHACRSVSPLSKQSPEKIEALRKWAVRARPASAIEGVAATPRRSVELDIS